jgi:hypothetical protein
MRIAHLADVHLGFRQYHRLTSNGVNQREADVAQAFRHAIDQVIEAAPEIVIVAGDLFNSVRPSNPAILHSFGLFSRLRGELPDTPVVIVAGNHDTPRSVETGTILKLFEAVPGVHVVAEAARDLVFEELDLTVSCVPHQTWLSATPPTLAPRGGTAHHVLATHGEVAGVLPRDAWALEHGGAVVEPSDLHADEWDYVALGHYHVAHQVQKNAWYSGSLEYVSPNPWGELIDETREGREGQKGWLLVQLGSSVKVQFRPVPLARRLIALPAIHASGLSPEDINAQIRESVDAVNDGIDDQIVRQVVFEIPRPIARDLDHAMIREFKTRALHFHLDTRRPESRREIGVGAPGTRQTLGELLADYLKRRPLDGDVDRKRLVALGQRYMAEVEQAMQDE